MTKLEFIEELKQRLFKLSDNEVNKAVSFYSENIDDKMESGYTEEEAVATLDIDKIVSELLVDTPLASLIQKRIKASYKKSGNKTLWIVLAICGFPFWFPICAAIAAVAVAVFVIFWALAFSFLVMAAAFLLAGLAGTFYGIYICFAVGPVPGLFITGSCIALFGLGIVSIRPLFWLFKKFAKAIPAFFRKIKRLFVPKKVEVIK